jgi:drug/metabolite transporter (DMT)-like permease
MAGEAVLAEPAAGAAGVPRAARERLVGIGLMSGALVFFASLDCSAKWLAHQGVHPMLTVWARYVGSVVLVSLFINPVRVPGVMRSRRPLLQWFRSLLLFGSTALNFVALRHLQLAETLSIQFATPLAVAILAVPMLGERTGPQRLAAIAVGFLGVLVIVRPDAGTIQPAVLLTLGNMVCYALYIVTTRMLAAHDSSATTMVYSGLAGVVFLTPLLPWIWETPATLADGLVMLGMGALGALGHGLLVLAHARAPAAVLAPFIYTQIIWSAALGFLVFGDVPSGRTLAGSAIVVASGAYLLWRERVRGVEPSAAPRA